MLTQLLSGYSVLEGRFDEMLSEDLQPRPPWGVFLDALATRQGSDVKDTLSLIEKQIRESGITYNVYADPMGADRPWELDPLPLLLSADEWADIEQGICQRAELLNRVLIDIYGPQELLRSGAIPPGVVFGHRGFLHQVRGIAPAGGVHLFQYAADLARSPDGKWWVVSDRTQAPSGAGYSLENRLAISKVFPQLFRDMGVEQLAQFFVAMRDALLHWAPKGDGTPLIVLLTPGPYNETYFEHALLAKYLGLTLVEGSDLTVRHGCVWMKTVDGLRRVHGLVRRQDDDYCDPLELRSDSALGVAGLTECVRRGTIMLGNALGSGVLESGGLLGYLPELSQRLMGESLKLPSVATWWLGEPAAFEDAWKRLDHLLIKPLDSARGEHAVFGADLDQSQRDALHARVASNPQHYVAQEWVHLSQAPVLDRNRSHSGEADVDLLKARTVGLRVFAVATPQGYRVMPGGLTRVAGDVDSRVIAMQRGGRSKDTWVLSETAVNTSLSLPGRTVRSEDLVSGLSTLPSRAAENLYWFGRYAERCDASIRLLRVALGDSVDDLDAQGAGIEPAVLLARQWGLIEGKQKPAADLLQAATDNCGGLSACFKQLQRVAFNLRDRMSADHWRTLNTLTTDAVFRHEASVPMAMSWLDRAVTTMMTLSGFGLDGMVRGAGWRFMSMGRCLERLSWLCSALLVATSDGRTRSPGWLLRLADSSVTYHARYQVGPEWLPVLDMLVRDLTNPRSLAFQLRGLIDHSDKLEASHHAFARPLLNQAQLAMQRLDANALNPDDADLKLFLEQLYKSAYTLSDELTLRFFSHASSRSVLSLVA